MDGLKGILLLSCLAFGFRDLVNGNCSAGWLGHDVYCYLFSHYKATWYEASTFCRGLHSTLAEINTNETDTFIGNIAKQQGHSFWVGGSDILIEGEWVWLSTQKEFTYSHWLPGEPNRLNASEDCLNINWYERWNDMKCTTKLQFICQSLASDAVNIVG